ncbi:hypothetical protein BJY24_005704 [Nocardia transvalensis]|uniref:Integrase n=1 Tax=Nocardia transvalensis TaxID=37333 RepID=A0A7W9PIG3_9NOCA|nr:hypothetical protein [Nocardia transvalensis]MBB5916792.1 hypothetical protein [Nocardia transvalensis]
MNTPAPELDSYVLPLPTPDSLVVTDRYVSTINGHLNSRYRDPVWSLGALTGNPSSGRPAIRWHHCRHEGLREQLRLVAWTMINGRLRPSFVAERSHRIRARISVQTVKSTVQQWIQLAEWLNSHGITSLAECRGNVFDAYAQRLLAPAADLRSHRVQHVLTALTRLWAFDQLCARPTGIARPPWDIHGTDDYLTAARHAGGENSTEPVAEQTLGPLLVWAMRMVDDFADDILAARTEHQRLLTAATTNRCTPAGEAELRAFLDPVLAAERPVPAIAMRGGRGLAATYLAGRTGASLKQVKNYASRHRARAAAAQRPGPCPLDTPITGRIAGAPWRDAIDIDEVNTLVRHLGTAAFIVCAYLTGMRPGEVLGLRAGCCPDPVPGADGTSGRHVVRGNEFKSAFDEDGNHLSTGIERDVGWVAIAPVVNAVRVLERMVPAGHLLFDHATHDRMKRPGTGSLKPVTLHKRIRDFIAWANTQADRHHRTSETIPPDPHGPIGVSRFRRSLAWHIARRPNGTAALAIQYGHLRTTVSAGYAARGRGGIHELLDIETARAVADTVTTLHDDLQAGGGVSGPAARRAITAATTAPRFTGTTITATTARRLLANKDARLYDNPHALLLCHYTRERALCHRDEVADTPTLDHCVPGCGNIARTDDHAHQLRRRANILDQQAAHIPGPLADRLHANAEKLRGHAENHDRTRITRDSITEGHSR